MIAILGEIQNKSNTIFIHIYKRLVALIMRNYVVLLVSIICSVTGFPTNNGRITGGGIASPAQFPYVVSVTEDGRHFCGGFIYSQNFVVTTASCVFGKYPSKLKVVVGQQELTMPDPKEEIIPVFQIYIMDRYNSTSQFNDVALLQLMQNISFSSPDQVYFINYNEVDASNAEGTTVGWGVSQEGGYESTRLRYASMTIPNAITCGDYSGQEFQPGIMICASSDAGTPDAGAPCQYDEGSPMIQTINGRPAAVGIMSKNKDCSTDLPSVYTRLSVYYAWFTQLAGQQPVDSLTTSTAGPNPESTTAGTSTTTETSTTSTIASTTETSSSTTTETSTTSTTTETSTTTAASTTTETTTASSTTTEAITTTRFTLTPTTTTREPITLPPDFTIPTTTTQAPIFTRTTALLLKASAFVKNY